MRTDFHLDSTLGDEERAMLVDLYGARAVELHAVSMANFCRVYYLFPRHVPTEAEIKIRAARPK